MSVEDIIISFGNLKIKIMELIKVIDQAINAREKALNIQIKLLSILIAELNEENPDVFLCVKGMQAIKRYSKQQLSNPHVLNIIKKRILELNN